MQKPRCQNCNKIIKILREGHKYCSNKCRLVGWNLKNPKVRITEMLTAEQIKKIRQSEDFWEAFEVTLTLHKFTHGEITDINFKGCSECKERFMGLLNFNIIESGLREQLKALQLNPIESTS